MAYDFLLATTQAVVDVSGVLTMDCYNSGNNQTANFTCLLKANVTSVVAPLNPKDGMDLYILFTNTTGNFTVAGWNAVFKFSGNAAPTIQTGAHDSLVAFHYFAVANKWVEFSREITLP